MARTKGSTNVTNKKDSSKTKTVLEELTEKKRRGRKEGQIIERDPAVVTLIGTEFKTKEDTMNRTLFEKGKSENNEDDIESNEAGWKFVGHYPPREDSWNWIFDEIVQRLKLKKARKEIIITYERHKELEQEARKKAEKIFKNAGFDVTKRKDK